MLDLGRSGLWETWAGPHHYMLDLGRSGLWETWAGPHNVSHVGGVAPALLPTIHSTLMWKPGVTW